MAKKAVATLRTGGGQNLAKCIKMVKNPETGAYQFKETVTYKESAKDFFNKKK
ncbi:MAG: DUF4295 domain-containing protein [Bacteroidota bacterium]|jgi:hypothetical protein|nr:DUF4295 domain-containing protein [Bacteroidales bacterium]MDI9534597.1 DUF4295 domain-containing protein [Bacteroidota bacterium]OQC46373.1 MAG: hypothetical protein BWX59_00481 [Bacteroidetes bacterium ADurb.Bin028]NLP21000.1 DUF4295 domain-containing protein [Bacteroidales bacterium]HNY43155.1 DUF4295 domain-containing protein [Bacteroidales bacterium]